MRNPTRKAVQGVFGALMVGALGFGASQAFAAPGAGAAAGSCLKEETWACNAYCRETFGMSYIGRCNKNTFGHVSCGCIQLPSPTAS